MEDGLHLETEDVEEDPRERRGQEIGEEILRSLPSKRHRRSAYDFDQTAGPQLENVGRRSLRSILLPEADDVIDAATDLLRNFREVGGRRHTADVRRRGDDGLAEMLAERF